MDVLYEIPNALLRWTEHEDKAPWQQAVGPRGLWTTTYTRAWLLEQLIPRVLEYYAGNRLVRRFDPRKDIRAARTDRVPFERIVSPSQLISYVDDIQSWLTIYGTDVRVGSALLRPYYRAFADLAGGADRRAVDIPYCADKLGLAPEPDGEGSAAGRYDRVLAHLRQHAARVERAVAEDTVTADHLSRVFSMILKGGVPTWSQAQLNAAIRAVRPLWEQSRFEERYVFPNRW